MGGGRKKDPEALGVDFHRATGVDVQANLVHPLPFKSSVFDRVESHAFLEHLPATGQTEGKRDLLFDFTDEVWRILKLGGLFVIGIPHVRGRLAYDDPTHRRFFDDNALSHLWRADRDPWYPGHVFKLKSHYVDRLYRGSYHTQKYAPWMHQWAIRHKWGKPKMIYIELQKE